MSEHAAPPATNPYQQMPNTGYAQPQGYGQPQQQQYYPNQQQQSQQPQHPQQYNQPPQAYNQQIHVPVYQPNVGPCAAGGGHAIKEEFTACGLVCGVLLFPIGLICCLTMKDRTCMRCGMKFD